MRDDASINRWNPDARDLEAVLAWSRAQGLHWRSRRGAWVMEAASWVLAGLRIMPRRTFLEQYTTVIRHVAWAPWLDTSVKHPEDAWGRMVTVVHEVQHWIQWQRAPGWWFALGYLVSPRARARWEAEAYACNQELAIWRGHAPPSAEALAGLLKAYGCGPGARAEAQALLEASEAKAMARGPGQVEAVRRVLPLLTGLRKGG
jgi:hypothetical protein